MRRASFLILLVLVMPAAAFSQAPSSDSQTLQALLTEVRELCQELQFSLARMQGAQILLTRLQIQQVAVTHASQHLDEARSKLAEVQVVQKSEAAEISVSRTDLALETTQSSRGTSKRRLTASNPIWKLRRT